LRYLSGMGKKWSEAEKVELVERVCVAMEEEKLSLSKALKAERGLPSMAAILQWCSESPTLAARYAHAREAYVEHLLDETIDIAEDACDDIEIYTDPKTKRQYPRLKASSVKRAALRIATRESYARMVLPHKYGTQRMDVTSGGKALPAASGHDNRLDAILALAMSRRQLAAPSDEPIDITPEPVGLDEIMS
jgi:hypothetical protein